ncbi:GNAT family N-acetyltransferase [Filibacter tadaridae]|uniref:Acetyltransferase (GNAT) family protein n=1 Tax=Filibacter tadaridae TaxID=2483811 RepID=A0A3P5X1A7_9BACL|nr:GNAT family N-acetyltransferase [Filibacter tadaridae]VDC28077.1 Acetyltransferase (GNAT) family protein [Filibacter tadaridae]
MKFTVDRVDDLQKLDITKLVEESETEGYRFLSRLVDDYKDGTNTFNQPGEALFCIRDKGENIVAIGGVNQSPFSEDNKVARLQRFYVEADARRQGAGSALLKEITDHSRDYFNEITVRTESSKADAFYRVNGFDFDDSASETTHVMNLQK